MNSTKVISIGYERRSIEELIYLLKTNHVTKLLDIRELPLLRKKGSSKKALAVHLEQVGIGYIHLRQAGNPYYKQKYDLVTCLALYSSYLSQNPTLIQ